MVWAPPMRWVSVGILNPQNPEENDTLAPKLTIVCQTIWSTACLKMLLKYIDPCCQLMKLLYKPALFHSFKLSNRFWYSQGSGWQGKVTWCFLTPSNKSSAPPLKWKQWSTEILLYCQKEDSTKGDLHRCHNRENKWHRLYLAQDSLCFCFSYHKPQIRGEVATSHCQCTQEAPSQARTPRCQAASDRTDNSSVPTRLQIAEEPPASRLPSPFGSNPTDITAATLYPASLAPNTC